MRSRHLLKLYVTKIFLIFKLYYEKLTLYNLMTLQKQFLFILFVIKKFPMLWALKWYLLFHTN